MAELPLRLVQGLALGRVLRAGPGRAVQQEGDSVAKSTSMLLSWPSVQPSPELTLVVPNHCLDLLISLVLA